MKHQPLIEHFKSLGSLEQEQLIKHLIEEMSRVESSIESSREPELAKGGISCPSCLSKQIVGYGRYKQVQRYRCKDCTKTFNSLSGSAVHCLHKRDLLKPYLYLMLQGYSLRKITKQIDICLKTAFDWRHKILKGLASNDTNLKGVVEADETFFLYSEKGNKKKSSKARKRGGKSATKGISNDRVAVLTVYERKSGNSINTVICLGRITKIAIENGMGQWLDKKESILCTDSQPKTIGILKARGQSRLRTGCPKVQ